MDDEYQLMEEREATPRLNVPVVRGDPRTLGNGHDEKDEAEPESLVARGLALFQSLKPIEWLKLYAILGAVAGGIVATLLLVTGMFEYVSFINGLLNSTTLSIASLVVVIAVTVTVFGYVAFNLPVKYTVCFLVAIFYVIGVGATTFRDSIFEILNTSMLLAGVGVIVGSVVAFQTGRVTFKDLVVSEDGDERLRM